MAVRPSDSHSAQHKSRTYSGTIDSDILASAEEIDQKIQKLRSQVSPPQRKPYRARAPWQERIVTMQACNLKLEKLLAYLLLEIESLSINQNFSEEEKTSILFECFCKWNDSFNPLEKQKESIFAHGLFQLNAMITEQKFPDNIVDLLYVHLTERKRTAEFAKTQFSFSPVELC